VRNNRGRKRWYDTLNSLGSLHNAQIRDMSDRLNQIRGQTRAYAQKKDHFPSRQGAGETPPTKSTLAIILKQNNQLSTRRTRRGEARAYPWGGRCCRCGPRRGGSPPEATGPDQLRRRKAKRSAWGRTRGIRSGAMEGRTGAR
jgi:hypothetical protein